HPPLRVSCPCCCDSLEYRAAHCLPSFFTSRRRHTRSVSAFLLNRSSDLPPSPTKSSNLSETAEVPACNVPSRSPLPALAIAPETKLGTASSGLGTLEP